VSAGRRHTLYWPRFTLSWVFLRPLRLRCSRPVGDRDRSRTRVSTSIERALLCPCRQLRETSPRLRDLEEDGDRYSAGGVSRESRHRPASRDVTLLVAFMIS